MLNLYTRIILWLGLTIVTFGFVGPKCISAKDTTLVLFGIIFVVIYIPIIIKLTKEIINDVKQLF